MTESERKTLDDRYHEHQREFRVREANGDNVGHVWGVVIPDLLRYILYLQLRISQLQSKRT